MKDEALRKYDGTSKGTDKQNSNSNEKLLEQVPIEGTPFTAVKYNDEWFLTLGKYRLTEKLKTLEECKEDATDASWYRIMQIVNIMLDERIDVIKKMMETTKN